MNSQEAEETKPSIGAASVHPATVHPYRRCQRREREKRGQNVVFTVTKGRWRRKRRFDAGLDSCSTVHLDQRHALDQCQAMALNARNFSRIVGEQTNLTQPQRAQHLCAQAVLAQRPTMRPGQGFRRH